MKNRTELTYEEYDNLFDTKIEFIQDIADQLNTFIDRGEVATKEDDYVCILLDGRDVVFIYLLPDGWFLAKQTVDGKNVYYKFTLI